MATRTNLCVNPSIEIDLAEFAPYDANTTLTRDTTQFRTGVASVKSTVNLATTWHGPAIFIDGLTVGQTYTASAYARNSSGTNVVSVWAGGTAGDPVTLDSTWKRVSKTFVATLATNQGIMFLDSSGSLGDSFFIDNILVEHTDVVRDYFDGSFPFASWSGTPYASTSTWTFSPFNVSLKDPGTKFDIRFVQIDYVDPKTEHWGFLENAPPDEYITGYSVYLDAYRANSYGGSGTTWTDLSGNSRNGTLTSGPTYNATDRSIVFDGTDDYVTGTIPTTTMSSFCMQGWVKITGGTNGGCFFKMGNNSGGIALGIGTSTMEDTGTNLVALFPAIRWIPTTTSLGSGWKFVSMNMDASSVPTFYINGVLVSGTYSGTAPAAPTTSYNLGRCIGDEGTGRAFQGEIGSFVTYNRVVTAAEVLVNFNRTKKRYGY